MALKTYRGSFRTFLKREQMFSRRNKNARKKSGNDYLMH